MEFSTARIVRCRERLRVAYSEPAKLCGRRKTSIQRRSLCIMIVENQGVYVQSCSVMNMHNFQIVVKKQDLPNRDFSVQKNSKAVIRSNSAVLVTIGVLFSLCFGLDDVLAQYPPVKDVSNPNSVLKDLKGKVIDLWTTDGKAYAGGEVLAVRWNRSRGMPTSLRVAFPVPISVKKMLMANNSEKKTKRKTKARWFGAKKISEIYLGDRPLDVSYVKKYKTIEYSSVKRQKRKKHQDTVRKRLASKRKKYWKNLTDKDQQEFNKKLDKMLEKIKTAFERNNLDSRETDFFVLATDLPPQQANFYLFQLDEMYKKLSVAFGLSPQKNIWCGKCLAVIFKDESSFMEFENRLHEFEPTLKKQTGRGKGAVGICHYFNDGRVVFAGYQAANKEFPNTVVHETTHGFVYRYQSNVVLPNWLNEGLSDWASAQIAGKARIIRKQKFAAREAARNGGWGTDFLKAPNIAAWQYGVASSVVDILLKAQKKDEFRRFVDLIKEGHDAEEALKMTFNLDFKELEAAYFRKATGRPLPQPAVGGTDDGGQESGRRR